MKLLGRTHLLFSVILGLFYIDYFGFEGSKILFYLTLAVGSLLPDIDHPKSILGRKIWPVSSIINFLFGHRSIMHSLFFIFAVCLLVYFLWPLYFIPAFIGLLSHLFLDVLSKEGLNLLYPLRIFYVKGFIKVGGLAENLFFLCLIILTILKIFA